jgi:Asp-tRNA(Asn)/Glu-tRNA(Gln) amidotransferase A subunit family amidase
MATPIWQWSAVDTAAAIRDGRATSEEVVQAHIDRMHTANPAINAIVVDLSAQAIEAARAADRALAQGATPGKLQGVPVTIKINIDVEGQANSNGVVAFKDNIAPGDSPVTANLKKAGAIIIGITNTPEFSMRGFTDNPLHGPTLNPWVWGDPAVTALIDSRGKLTEAQVREKLYAEIEQERSSGVQYWALFDHRNGDFVGCGGLRPWVYTLGEADFEVGFHLVKRCWGKGFGTEAALA